MTETLTESRLSTEERRLLDAYWRAASYVSVGQIYLLDNPLLKEPLGQQQAERHPVFKLLDRPRS
jgi:xylulose-5-phosphate/fructose-6-phosphate phosphoketolase